MFDKTKLSKKDKLVFNSSCKAIPTTDSHSSTQMCTYSSFYLSLYQFLQRPMFLLEPTRKLCHQSMPWLEIRDDYHDSKAFFFLTKQPPPTWPDSNFSTPNNVHFHLPFYWTFNINHTTTIIIKKFLWITLLAFYCCWHDWSFLLLNGRMRSSITFSRTSFLCFFKFIFLLLWYWTILIYNGEKHEKWN